jgi:hypothetical protein
LRKIALMKVAVADSSNRRVKRKSDFNLLLEIKLPVDLAQKTVPALLQPHHVPMILRKPATGGAVDIPGHIEQTKARCE